MIVVVGIFLFIAVVGLSLGLSESKAEIKELELERNSNWISFLEKRMANEEEKIKKEIDKRRRDFECTLENEFTDRVVRYIKFHIKLAGLRKDISEIFTIADTIKLADSIIEEKKKNAIEAVNNASNELLKGAPFLSEKIAELIDLSFHKTFQTKRIALRANELIKEIREKRKQAEYRARVSENKLALIEHIFPNIKELKIDEYVDSETEIECDNDSGSDYIERDEFFSLSPAERGDILLHRYWRNKKTKHEIGKVYERYIGSLYEQDGYNVCFFGIKNGLEDRGIDLICENEKEIILIQCKNWSSNKTIFENVVFQFYGSVQHYKFNSKSKTSKKIRGMIFATTDISEFAKEAISEMKIKFERKEMDYNYPCVKCNISATGEKIYHLPFDQQYDRIKIERSRGEFYAYSCKDAESFGFRRALRHAEPSPLSHRQ